MIRITLSNGAEKQLIELKETHELLYSDFVQLRWYSNKIVSYFEKFKDDTFYDFHKEYLVLIAECLSETTGVDINKFFDLTDKGDDKEHIKEMSLALDGKYHLKHLKNTLYSIYQIAINQIHAYKPRLAFDDSFDFTTIDDDGIETSWSIPKMKKDVLTNEPINPKFKTGKAIEIYDLRKLYNGKLESIEATKDKINTIFQRDLFTISLVMEKKDEVFPKQLNEIDAFINERAKQLQNIPMSVGRDAVFFLSSSSKTLEQLNKINGILNRLQDNAQEV